MVAEPPEPEGGQERDVGALALFAIELGDVDRRLDLAGLAAAAGEDAGERGHRYLRRSEWGCLGIT